MQGLTILRDFGLRVRDHAVNDVVGFEIHHEARIFPARNRRLADGGIFGDRSSEPGRYLVHGHAASRSDYIGLLHRNALRDRAGLGPCEAAGERCSKQQVSKPYGAPHLFTPIAMITLTEGSNS